MLAKGSWKIDPAQTLSGSLRYYNNDAQEPKTRKPPKPQQQPHDRPFHHPA
jgi:hemoglobin/transferrin/lactoferrin receptor protein